MSSLAFELQRLQNEIEEEVGKYNQIDKKGQQLAQARNSLYEQENENSLVLKEIELVQDGKPLSTQTQRSSNRWAGCSSTRPGKR